MLHQRKSFMALTNRRFTTLLVLSGGKTPDVNARGYTQIMKEQLLKGEENDVSKIASQKL